MRPRAAGSIVLAMSAAVLAVAVGVSVWYHLGLPGQIGGFALSLPGLALAWLAYRAGYVVPTLATATDQLAGAVEAQWKTELRARWLDGPEQLPVSWLPVPTDLSGEEPARSKKDRLLAGAGIRDHRQRISKLGRPSRYGENLDELHRMATGPLVVLGAPGSGKTVLLTRLVLKLVEHRKAGDPVPILVPLASWDPSSQSLRSWLLARLTVDHPGLKNPAPAQFGKVNLAEVMLDRHLFVLLLDGLDEIARWARKTAVEQINSYLRPGERLFLSCRTDEYLDVFSSEDPQFRQLAGTAMMLRPLTRADIARYLQSFPGGAPAGRWERVLRELRSNAVLAEVLSTPLMVDLAHIVYNRGHHEADRLGPHPDPAELCDSVRFATPADLRAHLFDAFIDAAYRSHGAAGQCRWDIADVKRWLAFLAHHLESDLGGAADLAWWTLRSSAPTWLVPLVTGIICGTTAGLAAGLGRHAGLGIGLGLGAGMISGLTVGLAVRQITNLAKRAKSPLEGIAGGLAGALVGAVAAGVAGEFGFGRALGPFGGLDVALGIGVGVGSSTSFSGGLAGGLVGGFVGALARGVAEGIPAGLVNGLGSGLAAAFAVALVARKTPASSLRWSPVGALGGLTIGAAVGLITTSVEGPAAGALLGISIGILSSWPCGLTGLKAELSKAASPRNVFTYDRRTFFRTAFAAGLPAGIAGFVGGGLTSVFEVRAHADPAALITDGLGIGLASALIIGLAFGFYHAAYGPFVINHLWLVLRRRIPWQLMPFLADAHEKRGILRESGAFYQFRHIDLQRQIARTYSAGPVTPVPVSVKPPGRARRRRIRSRECTARETNGAPQGTSEAAQGRS